ncbi:MAG: SRPBCC family protein [Candidatus Binatia bacterium]
MGASLVSHETVSSEIAVGAPPDRVLEVLCDFEAYPQWARSVREARVLERGPDGRPDKVEFVVTAGPLGKMRYVLRYAYPASAIEWDYVEGDLRDIKGSYVVDATDDGARVTYHLLIDPGKLPLPGFVKARAAREITKVALKELKRRVEAL